MAIQVFLSNNEPLYWEKLNTTATSSIKPLNIEADEYFDPNTFKELIHSFSKGFIPFPTNSSLLFDQIHNETLRLLLDKKLIAIIGSSGSTAQPKLVPIQERQIIASISSAPTNLLPQKGEQWLLCLPIVHMGGLAVLLRSFFNGNDVVVSRSMATMDIAKALFNYPKISTLSLVPTQLYNLLEDGIKQKNGLINRLRRCRSILLGGGPAGEQLRHLVHQYALPVIYSYGSSETFGQIFAISATEIQPESIHQNIVGKINAPNEFKITDDQQLLIKGPQLIDCYLSNHQLNKDADGWYYTGDIAQLDEHQNIEILMRRTDLIISGGKNISPLEVEASISKLFEHRGITNSLAAVGVKDKKWGEIIGLVVEMQLLQSLGISKDTFEKACISIPKSIQPRTFKYVQKLPRTAIGKIQRQQLKLQWEANSN